MNDLGIVFTGTFDDPAWMANSSIDDEGKVMKIDFKNLDTQCFERSSRMLIGLHAYDLRLNFGGQIHPAEVRFTVEQLPIFDEGIAHATLFESEFTMTFENQFVVIGLLTFCDLDGDGTTMTFTGFEGNSSIDFIPF